VRTAHLAAIDRAIDLDGTAIQFGWVIADIGGELHVALLNVGLGSNGRLPNGHQASSLTELMMHRCQMNQDGDRRRRQHTEGT
jgi:hypothetical protein